MCRPRTRSERASAHLSPSPLTSHSSPTCQGDQADNTGVIINAFRPVGSYKEVRHSSSSAPLFPRPSAPPLSSSSQPTDLSSPLFALPSQDTATGLYGKGGVNDVQWGDLNGEFTHHAYLLAGGLAPHHLSSPPLLTTSPNHFSPPLTTTWLLFTQATATLTSSSSGGAAARSLQASPPTATSAMVSEARDLDAHARQPQPSRTWCGRSRADQAASPAVHVNVHVLPCLSTRGPAVTCLPLAAAHDTQSQSPARHLRQL